MDTARMPDSGAMSLPVYMCSLCSFGIEPTWHSMSFPKKGFKCAGPEHFAQAQENHK